MSRQNPRFLKASHSKFTELEVNLQGKFISKLKCTMFCLIGMGKVANKNIPQLLMDHGKYPKITKKLLRFAPTNNENYGPNPRHFFCQKGCEELKTTSDRSVHKIFSFSENVFPPSEKYRFFGLPAKNFPGTPMVDHPIYTIQPTKSSDLQIFGDLHSPEAKDQPSRR